MLNWLKRKFFTDWFPKWSPDAALRYLPIVEDIKHNKNLMSILDVGSGSLGITPYLKRKVTGLDKNFSGPESSYLQKVRGFANKLPFKNNSFDAVVCVDVLEHVSGKTRPKIINELVRIAKRKIYLAFPCGKAAEKDDRYFASYIRNLTGKSDPYLQEHLIYGLPKIHQVLALISTEYHVTIQPNVNIRLHHLILKFQFAQDRIGRFVSSVIFILLLPLFKLLNFEPSYRKIIVVDKMV